MHINSNANTKLLIITETIGQEALEHWALSFEHWYQDSQLLTLTFWIIQYHVISIVPFIRPWGNTCLEWPLQVSTVTVYRNIQNSQKCEFIYQSDPTDRFGNDVSIFEDGYLCMYPSSRRWSTTYVPVFAKMVYYVQEPISGQDNFLAADRFLYVV